MRIVTLGASANAPSRHPFRGATSLARADAVFVDFDAIRAEFDADSDVLSVRDSDALLRAARHWRDELARFMQEERIIVVGWTAIPLIRYHTLQDIFEFTLHDLLPGIAPRVVPGARFNARPTLGAPFAAFYRALCGALSTDIALTATRGEPILSNELAGAKAKVGGLYVYRAPAHIVFTAMPPAPRIEAALRVLGETLGAGRASTFLPRWVDEVAIEGETASTAALANLEASAARIDRELIEARRATKALRQRKAMVGGTLDQAAAVAAERLRELGAVVMREFPDEHAFATVDAGGRPLLWFFVAANARSISVHLGRLCDRYHHEFDETPHGIVVVVPGPHADSTAATAPTLPEVDEPMTVTSGYALLRALSEPATDLESRLARFTERGAVA